MKTIKSLHFNIFRYDPYSKIFSAEHYDFNRMKKNRFSSIERAKSAKTFGLICSTLGRQGSVKILENLKSSLLRQTKDAVVILMSEIFPQKLKLFSNIDS